MSKALKNVVVVGLGTSGILAAKALAVGLPADYRVVAVSDTDFAFYHIGALRAAVQEGFEDKIIGPLDNVFPKGSRHVVKAGVKVTKLNAHSLTLANGEEIPFVFAILAMGSTYAFPCRAPSDWSATQLKSAIKQMRQHVAESSNILVIGAGATGVEFAGEVAAQYGAKKTVTLVHPSATLFSNGFKEKLGKNLDNSLKAVGVKVVGNTRLDTQGLESGPVRGRTFTLGDGSTITPDFVFLGFGSKPNSELVKAFDAQLVDSNGFVKVKPTLQVEDATSDLDHIFVIGDVTNVKESKQAVTAKAQAPIAAANVLSLIKGKAAGKSYSAAKPLIVVTVGPKRGAGQLFGLVIGDFFTAKMKGGSLFLPAWQADYGIKA